MVAFRRFQAHSSAHLPIWWESLRGFQVKPRWPAPAASPGRGPWLSEGNVVGRPAREASWGARLERQAGSERDQPRGGPLAPAATPREPGAKVGRVLGRRPGVVTAHLACRDGLASSLSLLTTCLRVSLALPMTWLHFFLPVKFRRQGGRFCSAAFMKGS